jgi:hypothetical protein
MKAGLEYVIGRGGTAHTEEDLVVGGLGRIAVDEAVDIVIIVSETVPHAADGDGAETGVEVSLFRVRDEMAAGREAAVGLW